MKKILPSQTVFSFLFIVTSLLFVSAAAAQKTWDGGAGTTLWADGNNWNPNGVPAATDDVTISSVAVTMNAAGAAKSLTIASGASLALNATLTIADKGAVVVNGTLQFNASATIAGGGNGSNGVNVTLANGATLITAHTNGITGSIVTNTGNKSHSFATGANYTFNGAGQTIGNSLPATVNNLTLSGSGSKTMPATALTLTGNLILGGTASATAVNALTVGGNATIGSGTTFSAGSFSHPVAGNWTNNGTFNPGTGTILFNGSAAQSINTATTFNNLTISNTASAVSTTANITVAGALSVSTGAVLAPGASNTVGGGGTLSGNGTVQVSATGSASDFNTQYTINKTLGSLTVEYAGSAAQGVSALSYGALKISNAAGATLAGSASVSSTLTLGSGLLNIPADTKLTLTSPTAVAGGPFGDNKHIATLVNTATGTKGALQVNSILNASYTFPVGNGTYYLPATVTPSGTSNYSVTVFTGVTTNGEPNGNPTPRSTLVDAVWNVSNVLNNGVSTILSLSWPSALERSGFVSDDSRIGIAHYSGGKWDNLVGIPDGNTKTATRVGLTTFSPFMAGYIQDNITLPVVFTEVKAVQESGGTRISWSNATEEGVEGYVVERSTDGRSYRALTQVAATGNANGKSSYGVVDASGINGDVYYRIKAMEQSGKATYSAVVKVGVGIAGMGLSVYPNPVRGEQVSFTANNLPGGLYGIRVYTATGELISSRSIHHGGGSISEVIGLGGVKPGQYVLEVKGVVRMYRHVLVQ